MTHETPDIVSLLRNRNHAQAPTLAESMMKQAADVVSGTVYESENYCICEIDWIDKPRPGEITQMMEAAADAIDKAAED